MPAYNSALTSPELALLRASHYETQHNVSFFGNRVVWAGQTADSGTDNQFQSWAVIIVNNFTQGHWYDVEKGMTILLGPTNDITKAVFRGRARDVATNDGLAVNENSTAVPIGWYFWVLDQFEIWDILSRPVTDSSTPPIVTQYVDYNVAFDATDYLPASIIGLQTIYAGWCDPGTGKLRLTLTISTSGANAYVMQAGLALHVDYAFVFRAGVATVISGSLTGSLNGAFPTSQTLVVDIIPGETWGTLNYHYHSSSTINYRKFGIQAHDATHLPTTGVDNIQIRGDLQKGYTATVPAFAGVDSILPQTPAIVWRSNEVYGTTPGLLVGNNVDFIGYLRKDDPKAQGDPTYSVLEDTTFELIGPGARLAYLASQNLALINEVSTPTAWDHIQLLTPKRAAYHVLIHHTTYATLCDVDFDALSDDTFQFPIITIQGSNLLTALNSMLDEVNAAIEFYPNGASYICRDARYLDQTGRDALTTIAGFTSSDGLLIGASKQYEKKVGKVDADGATYLGDVVKNVTAFRARAPGVAQGESQGSSTLPNQILASGLSNSDGQGELDQRAGNKFEIDNLQETITIEHPDGYNFIVPSRVQWYTWVLDATLAGVNNVNRIIYGTDVRWLVTQVSYTLSNDGTTKVQITYTRASRIGDPAYPVIITPSALSTIPPLPPYPFPPNLLDLPPVPDVGGNTLPPVVLPKDGNVVVVCNATRIWITSTFANLANPVWKDVSVPSLGSFQLQQVLFDPFSVGDNKASLYALANDGTSSIVYHCKDALAAHPVWSVGITIPTVYTIIRGTNQRGVMELYGHGAPITDWIIHIDYTVTDSTPTMLLYSSTGGTGAGWFSGTGITAGTGGFQLILRFNLSSAVPCLFNYFQCRVKAGMWTFPVNDCDFNGPQRLIQSGARLLSLNSGNYFTDTFAWPATQAGPGEATSPALPLSLSADIQGGSLGQWQISMGNFDPGVCFGHPGTQLTIFEEIWLAGKGTAPTMVHA